MESDDPLCCVEEIKSEELGEEMADPLMESPGHIIIKEEPEPDDTWDIEQICNAEQDSSENFAIKKEEEEPGSEVVLGVESQQDNVALKEEKHEPSDEVAADIKGPFILNVVLTGTFVRPADIPVINDNVGQENNETKLEICICNNFCGKVGKKCFSQTDWHSCSLCGKRFQQGASLLKHGRAHKIYVCSQCGKSCITKAALLSHAFVHSGRQLHTCAHCGKGFAAKRDLREHVREHTGELPFSCELCNGRFGKIHLLDSHIRRHVLEGFSYKQCYKGLGKPIKNAMNAGLKSFLCEFCGRSYYLKELLLNHKKTHAVTEKPYLCTLCRQGFASSGSLWVHYRKHIVKNNQ